MANPLDYYTAQRANVLDRLASGEQVDPQETTQLDQFYSQQQSEFTKGLRRFGYSTRATTEAFVGQMAEPFAPEFAKRRAEGARQTIDSMPYDTRPKYQTFDEADAVGTPEAYLDYGTGAFGEGLGSVATMIGAGLLSRGAAARFAPTMKNAAQYAGSMGAMLPMEGGETAMQLQDSPEALANTSARERALMTLGRGTANAALESIVPNMLFTNALRGANRIATGVMPSLTNLGRKTAAGIIGEAGTEGAQDLTGQYVMNQAVPGTGYDLAHTKEAAIRGAITGGVLGAAGAGVQSLQSNIAPGIDKLNEYRDKKQKEASQSYNAALNSAYTHLDNMIHNPEQFGEDMANTTLGAMAKISAEASKVPEYAIDGMDLIADLREKAIGMGIRSVAPENRESFARMAANIRLFTPDEYQILKDAMLDQDEASRSYKLTTLALSVEERLGEGFEDVKNNVSNYTDAFVKGVRKATREDGKRASAILMSKEDQAEIERKLDKIDPSITHALQTAAEVKGTKANLAYKNFLRAIQAVEDLYKKGLDEDNRLNLLGVEAKDRKSDEKLAEIRKDYIGYIAQLQTLLAPTTSVKDVHAMFQKLTTPGFGEEHDTDTRQEFINTLEDSLKIINDPKLAEQFSNPDLTSLERKKILNEIRKQKTAFPTIMAAITDEGRTIDREEISEIIKSPKMLEDINLRNKYMPMIHEAYQQSRNMLDAKTEDPNKVWAFVKNGEFKPYLEQVLRNDNIASSRNAKRNEIIDALINTSKNPSLWTQIPSKFTDTFSQIDGYELGDILALTREIGDYQKENAKVSHTQGIADKAELFDVNEIYDGAPTDITGEATDGEVSVSENPNSKVDGNTVFIEGNPFNVEEPNKNTPLTNLTTVKKILHAQNYGDKPKPEVAIPVTLKSSHLNARQLAALIGIKINRDGERDFKTGEYIVAEADRKGDEFIDYNDDDYGPNLATIGAKARNFKTYISPMAIASQLGTPKERGGSKEDFEPFMMEFGKGTKNVQAKKLLSAIASINSKSNSGETVGGIELNPQEILDLIADKKVSSALGIVSSELNNPNLQKRLRKLVDEGKPLRIELTYDGKYDDLISDRTIVSRKSGAVQTLGDISKENNIRNTQSIARTLLYKIRKTAYNVKKDGLADLEDITSVKDINKILNSIIFLKRNLAKAEEKGDKKEIATLKKSLKQHVLNYFSGNEKNKEGKKKTYDEKFESVERNADKLSKLLYGHLMRLANADSMDAFFNIDIDSTINKNLQKLDLSDKKAIGIGKNLIVNHYLKYMNKLDSMTKAKSLAYRLSDDYMAEFLTEEEADILLGYEDALATVESYHDEIASPEDKQAVVDAINQINAATELLGEFAEDVSENDVISLDVSGYIDTKDDTVVNDETHSYLELKEEFVKTIDTFRGQKEHIDKGRESFYNSLSGRVDESIDPEQIANIEKTEYDKSEMGQVTTHRTSELYRGIDRQNSQEASKNLKHQMELLTLIESAKKKLSVVTNKDVIAKLKASIKAMQAEYDKLSGTTTTNDINPADFILPEDNSKVTFEQVRDSYAYAVNVEDMVPVNDLGFVHDISDITNDQIEQLKELYSQAVARIKGSSAETLSEEDMTDAQKKFAKAVWRMVGKHRVKILFNQDIEKAAIYEPARDLSEELKKVRDDRANAVQQLKELKKEADKDKDLIAEVEAEIQRLTDLEISLQEDKAIRGTIRVAQGKEQQFGLAEHEAFHAAFSIFFGDNNKVDRRTIVTALTRGVVGKQVRKFFESEPEVLEAIENSTEEAAAYAFQIYVHDPSYLKLGTNTKGLFERFKQFLRDLLGMQTYEQRAQIILNDLIVGRRAEKGISPIYGNIAAEVSFRKSAQGFLREVGEGLMNIYDVVLTSTYDRVINTENPALEKIATLVYNATGMEGDGMLQRQRRYRETFGNRASRIFANMDEESLFKLNEAMIFSKRPTGELGVKYDQLRKVFKELYDYQVEAGIPLGNFSEYYPMSWSPEKVIADREGFMEMTKKYEDEFLSSKMSAAYLYDAIASYEDRGLELGDVMNRNNEPASGHSKSRKTGFISKEDRRPFMEDDPVGTTMRYIQQAVRHTEYVRVFGSKSEELNRLYEEAKTTYGADQNEIDLIDDFIDGAMGNKEKHMSRALKDTYGFITTYQNIRLLPFSLFASLVDPLGVAVRSNSGVAAFDTFAYSIKNLFRDWKSEYTPDQWEQIAMDFGAIDMAGTSYVVDNIYTGVTLRGKTKAFNDAFFKANLLNGWVRNNHIMAFKHGTNFLKRSAEDFFGEEASQRYLEELGLTKEDIVYDDGKGRIKLYESEGISKESEERLREALHKFVRQSLIQPSAPEMPTWMSNPYFAPIAHLKTFVWGFQKTIIDRLLHEAKNGNYNPIYFAAAYVPGMIAADFIKDMISNMGDEPRYKKDWNLWDYFLHGVNRSGLTGTGQFFTDMSNDVGRGGSGFESLSGPAIDQSTDFIAALKGNDPTAMGRWIVDAMPANAVYDQWIGF